MALKGKKIYSILTFTCPRCHEGKYFEHASSYRKGFADVKPRCEVCGQDYRKEPGFYFGAAYVSYSLTVALWIAVYVAFWVFDALGWFEFRLFEDGWLFLVVGTLVLLGLMPPLFRLSRIIWINLFVGYDPDAVATFQKQESTVGEEEG